MAEDAVVLVIPAVVPLRAPVVGGVETDIVVPVDVEGELYDGKVEVERVVVMEVQHRLALARQEGHHRGDGHAQRNESLPQTVACVKGLLNEMMYHTHSHIFFLPTGGIVAVFRR